MTKAPHRASPYLLFSLLCILVTGARLWVSQRGVTFDFESYVIVSDLVLQGLNVYEHTERYNYGPLWSLLLGTFRFLAPDPVNFHLLLVLFLTAVDIVIALQLRAISWWASYLFLLNPISLIVSGYYLQFDNLTLAIGIAAIRSHTLARRPAFVSGGIFALSLMMKHSLIFLPVCLVLYEPTRRAMTVAVVAYAGFLLSFVPYLNERSFSPIMRNVFLYQSGKNPGLVKGILEAWGFQLEAISYAFVLLIGVLAILTCIKERTPFKVFGVYCAAVFTLLPGMAAQYLVYPLMLWVQAPRNGYLLLYILLGTATLLSISPGLILFDHRFFRLAMLQIFTGAALLSFALPGNKPRKGSSDRP